MNRLANALETFGCMLAALASLYFVLQIAPDNAQGAVLAFGMGVGVVIVAGRVRAFGA